MAGLKPVEIANQLWPMIRRGNCIVWVGSGLSIQAGYPRWGDLITALCSACGEPSLAEGNAGADAMIEKAEQCKLRHEAAYKETLAGLYGRRVFTWRNAYNFIMDLPFHRYVTTNFDPILSTVGSSRKRPLHAYPALSAKHLFQGDPSVLYLHGIANVENNPTGDHLVLSRSEFDAAYHTGTGTFLFELLLSYPVLYIGSSISEPAMVEVFRRVRDARAAIERRYPEATPPQSYALVPTRYREVSSSSTEPARERDRESEAADESRFQALGIKPLWYDPVDRSHSEIEEVLGRICELADKMGPPKPSFAYGEDLPNG